MIDLHTHSFLSDGDFAPCELIRRAEDAGYKIMALTDHVDLFNVDQVASQIVAACDTLNGHSEIKVIPGVEVTHVEPDLIELVVERARQAGARLVVVHGETVVEPVKEGTNAAALKCKIDILAHPGQLTKTDAELAKRKGVYIEITTRKNHMKTNRHVRDMARKTGLKLVLNTDTHSPEDLIDDKKAVSFLRTVEFTEAEIKIILSNSKEIVKKAKLRLKK